MIKHSQNNTAQGSFPWIDLILFIVLTSFATWMIISKPWALDRESAAALSGAMYGGAALLLGNWINRVSEWRRTAAEAAQRIEKLKALIAAELVDVAIGLIEGKQLMDASIISLNAAGSVSKTLDMNRYRPRQLSLTESLSSELLVLDRAQIDALATLRTNLAMTRQYMDEITFGENFGLLRATELSNILSHDMTVLSKTFQLLAPGRKLHARGTEPELITKVLERAAAQTEGI
jgi:hypothetical protein